MVSGFVDFLFDPMNKSVGDMLLGFLKATAKMIAQVVMLNAVKAGMTALGFSMQAAKGAAFDGGVQAFASGGIVNSPTPFRFASGGSFKSCVMGEAGPEAILPVKRGSNGSLGVMLNGGSTSGNTLVNITINQNSNASQDSSSASGSNTKMAQALASQIKGGCARVIVTEKRPGGLLYA
jgi:phage-related minor tail protein